MKAIFKTFTGDLQLAGYSPRTVEAFSYHAGKFLDYFRQNGRRNLFLLFVFGINPARGSSEGVLWSYGITTVLNTGSG